ncbi:hypothetical protein D0Z08_04780 [Nocardioides immobilis]|uniref:Uncharacterized protein n=1 Tax=Nocardioides immobilis TaxID=2049295 RepID=A0A417Y6S4_9ACTN|nr:hypothetical protein [Nocardioides immobilis]RHW28295.1 hypothetical protein D0Z08_04780 [Nocardioides immobilis]
MPALEHRLNHQGRALSIVVLAGVACLFAAVVWFPTKGGDAEASGQAPSSSGEPTAVSTQEAPAAETAPKDGVTLPEGASHVDGYPVEFPYSDLGAVAAQAEVAKAQVGFDYDQAVAVAGVYSAPEYREVFETRSRESVALRRQQAGVPVYGDVPAPASYAVTPVAFTVEELATDYYAVNLLSYVTLTGTDGRIKDGLYAGTQLLQWIDGDWKLVQGSSEDIQRLVDAGQPRAVAPDTPAFDQAGWIRINGAPQ